MLGFAKYSFPSLKVPLLVFPVKEQLLCRCFKSIVFILSVLTKKQAIE